MHYILKINILQYKINFQLRHLTEAYAGIFQDCDCSCRQFNLNMYAAKRVKKITIASY
jgi:hypothetical protein